MIENKRYLLRQEPLGYPIMSFYCDLIDTANNDKVICSFELDVETRKMVDLLNKQDEHLNILHDELELAYKKYTELEKENAYLSKKLDYYYGRSVINKKRFMIDDAGSLIDKQTRKYYDYVSEVVDLLNEQNQQIKELEQEGMQLKEKNKKVNERNLCLNSELSYYQSQYWKIIQHKQLKEENKQLKEEVENLHEQLAHFLGDFND